MVYRGGGTLLRGVTCSADTGGRCRPAAGGLWWPAAERTPDAPEPSAAEGESVGGAMQHNGPAFRRNVLPGCWWPAAERTPNAPEPSAAEGESAGLSLRGWACSGTVGGWSSGVTCSWPPAGGRQQPATSNSM